MWKLKKTSPFLSIMVIIFITSPTPANMQSSRGRRISSVTEEFDKLWIKSSLNVVVAAATAAQAQQRGWYPSTWQNTDSFIWAFTEQRAAHKPAISSHLTRVPTDQKAKNKNANCRWKQGSLSIGSFRLTSELPTNTSVFTCGAVPLWVSPATHAVLNNPQWWAVGAGSETKLKHPTQDVSSAHINYPWLLACQLRGTERLPTLSHGDFGFRFAVVTMSNTCFPQVSSSHPAPEVVLPSLSPPLCKCVWGKHDHQGGDKVGRD